MVASEILRESRQAIPYGGLLIWEWGWLELAFNRNMLQEDVVPWRSSTWPTVCKLLRPSYFSFIVLISSLTLTLSYYLVMEMVHMCPGHLWVEMKCFFIKCFYTWSLYSISSFCGIWGLPRWCEWETFSWASKSLWMVTGAMKLKDACSLEEKLWQTKIAY